MLQVSKILTDPAYSGTYIYGKTRAQPGSSIPAGGVSKKIKLPEERWIKIFNHHPAYLSQEQQKEIKSILKSNSLKPRYPVARLHALTRGLLRCAVCGARLGICYPSKDYHFKCGRAHKFAEKPCITFNGKEFERCILREVFKVLKAPLVEMLKSALKASRHETRTRLSWIASERERLRRQEQAAQERAELTRGGLPCLYFDALQKLENVFHEIKQFEQRISLELTTPASDYSKEELDELCRISRDVPVLWQHEAVTHEERKEILHCLIDRISVAGSKERIDATIAWNSGSKTSLYVWRRSGWHYLIRELHAKQLTASEIKEHLAAGKTSTGQVVNLSLGKLNKKLHAMGLKASRFSADYLSLRQEAAELYREGRSVERIAKDFNKKAYVSASGKPWTAGMIYGHLHALDVKPESLDNIYYRLMADAHRRRLSYEEMAIEFNNNRIRRKGYQTWTVRNVRTRWAALNRAEDKRKQQEFSAASEASDLRRSA